MSAVLFSGHSGYHTSQLLSRALLPTIALSLSSLVSINNGESAFSPGSGKAPTREQAISHLASWKSWLFGGGDQTGKEPEAALLANDPENVKLALKNAFEALDRSIVWDRVYQLCVSTGECQLTQSLFFKPFTSTSKFLKSAFPISPASNAFLRL